MVGGSTHRRTLFINKSVRRIFRTERKGDRDKIPLESNIVRKRL